MSDRPPLTSFPTISPSDIDNYEGCPKRWHLKRILRDPRFKFQVTEAINYGNTTHEQLEKYAKHQTPLPEHLEYVAPFIDGLRAAGFDLYAELECAVTEDWTPVGWWDKTAWLRGKADLVAVKEDQAIIIDWKTGKRKPDPTQLKIYGAILHTVLGLRSAQGVFVWLKTQQDDKFEVNAVNVDEVRQEIVGRIDAMKDAYERQDFPARTTPLCGWCPALDTCSEAIYYKVQRDRKRR
jgi:CRISPR/Cas system-associated exonuclease Cas4 (RecB family)